MTGSKREMTSVPKNNMEHLTCDSYAPMSIQYDTTVLKPLSSYEATHSICRQPALLHLHRVFRHPAR